ncbi:MAG: chitobiase/beta-hexosaminidase C-terminal domain-containing protein, partial [Trichloromonadaceae bacterium]
AYTITVPDTTAPTASVSPAAGSYLNQVSVTLSAADNIDSVPKIYYTTNGSTPTTASAQYSAPLVLSSSATVKFFARDASGNQSAVQSAAYTITQPPVTNSGLKFAAADTALPGVSRADGGPVTSNLDAATGKPMVDVDYTFRVVYQDTSGAGESNSVYLVLNGYTFPMSKGSGTLASGINYTYTTWLGPASAWAFHYEVRDSSGNILFRLPQTGEQTGPSVRLLNGGNYLGVAKNLATAATTPSQAFGGNKAYAWVNNKSGRGRYQEATLIDAGTGYFVNDAGIGPLPALDQIPEQEAASFSISLTRGWNIISNPYGGNVKLSDVLIKQGSKAPIYWTQAASNKWLTNAIYYFRGSDWDSSNGFESAGGYPDAKLTPWIGYWVYLNASDGPYTLILPKPQK